MLYSRHILKKNDYLCRLEKIRCKIDRTEGATIAETESIR